MDTVVTIVFWAVLASLLTVLGLEAFFAPYGGL